METILKYFSDFTPAQLSQFESLKLLYEDWNQKINVISRKDMDHFYLHHVLHSLTIAAGFEFPDNYEVLDLGTGGGFPGVPLAIMFPNVNFLLADSINKKLKVVSAVSETLGITNITVRHTRAEEIKNRKFDVVVSRAVAPLGDLWRWSKPLLRRTSNQPNGLICLKGGDLTKEIFESGCKPHVWEINGFFEEDYFKEKFLLYQKV
ncbi:MAG: 16S rRNA (guanine(527)-N(7))-methyltransferase RsmG [Chitinophagaceae bacterium]|nr:MAG: 16S rRNA (guanine(527)-N(7))-methyltransferase RsmG [Chitinophagaceae bacterium]